MRQIWIVLVAVFTRRRRIAAALKEAREVYDDYTVYKKDGLSPEEWSKLSVQLGEMFEAIGRIL